MNNKRKKKSEKKRKKKSKKKKKILRQRDCNLMGFCNMLCFTLCMCPNGKIS
jgi:hypothetical protein